MAVALTYVTEFYVPASGYVYNYGGSYAAGTRVIFAFSSPYDLSVTTAVSADTAGNPAWSQSVHINSQGTAGFYQGKLTTPVTAAASVTFAGLEGYVRVYTATGDSGVVAVGDGAAAGVLDPDSLATPVSLAQSGSVSVDSVSLGVMMFGRVGSAVTLTFSGSAAEEANHEWTSDAGAYYAASFFSRTVAAGSYSDTNTGDAGGNINGWQAVQMLLVGSSATYLRGITHVYGANERLYLCRNENSLGIPSVTRYTDATPPVAGSSVRLNDGYTGAHELLRRRSEVFDGIYSLHGAVEVRTSTDRCRTWGTFATVAETGYRNPTACWDHQRGRLVVAMQNTSNLDWYLTVGGLDADGGFTDFSTPTLLAEGTGENSAQLLADRDGGLTFVWQHPTDGISALRATAYDSTSGATITDTRVFGTGYRHPAACWDHRRGLLIVALQKIPGADLNYYFTVSELDSAGDLGAFCTPVAFQNGVGDFFGHLTADPDGQFTFSCNALTLGVIVRKYKSISKSAAWSSL